MPAKAGESVMQLGFEQVTDNSIRIRAYTVKFSNSPIIASPRTGSFDWQVQMTRTQWNALLVLIGTGSGGAQAGTVGLEGYSPIAINAGSLPPDLQNT